MTEVNVSSSNSSSVAKSGKNVYVSEMLWFPVEWKLNYDDIWSSSLGLTSSLYLNHEWTLLCQWKGSRSYMIDSIEIRRKSDAAETSISGTLSIFVSEQRVLKQSFSKLIESESKVTKLIDLHVVQSLPEIYSYNSSNLSLHGIVNIVPINGKCTSDCKTRFCKLCKQPKSLVQLSDDFGRLLDPQTSCNADVNLKCGSASLPAHKLILSARSSVFAAMFKNEMKETIKNEVVITDIEASVLQAMLSYIYSGKISGLTASLASDLLFAADKYQLSELKGICCDSLKRSISMQNVMKFVYLGDLHDEDLKSFSVDYICKNYTHFAEFEKTEEWENLRKEKPALAVDVLTSLLISKDKKG